MKIDMKKLSAAISDVNAKRRGQIKYVDPLFGPDGRYTEAYKAAHSLGPPSANEYIQKTREYNHSFTAEWATRLYSLKAHLRGRLHVCKRWVAHDQPGIGQTLVLETKTMADQQALVEPLLAEFTIPEQSVNCLRSE